MPKDANVEIIIGDATRHALGFISKSKNAKGEDVYNIVASDNSIDRDNEVIELDAWRGTLPKYLGRNPVILWAHRYSELPVAKAVDGEVTDTQLRLQIVFAPDERAQIVKAQYDQGFLNSFSVGFIPKKWMRDENDILHFTEVELLEVSAVPVPANPSANILRNQGELALIGKSLLESWQHERVVDEPAEAKSEPPKRKRSFVQKRHGV